MNSSRRNFIKQSATSICMLPLHGVFSSCVDRTSPMEKLDVSIFSKHLQFLNYKETGEMAKSLGFDGVDLTVRPKGHVLPELVKTDLSKAINDIKAAGSACKMITTNIESVSNPLDVSIIECAGRAGISYYRTNWYKYLDGISMTQSLEQYQNQINELGKLNKNYNIIGCYQNHAGTKIGAAYWEIHELLKKVDPKYFGTQYDIRHATVDSGYSWINGLELLHEKIKVIVVKDFKWGKVNNQWKAINVPIGEGMVDFNKYFKLLKKYGLNPPVSLHLEYPLGGAEKGKYEITVDREIVYDAMTKDLNTIQELWKKA